MLLTRNCGGKARSGGGACRVTCFHFSFFLPSLLALGEKILKLRGISPFLPPSIFFLHGRLRPATFYSFPLPFLPPKQNMQVLRRLYTPRALALATGVMGGTLLAWTMTIPRIHHRTILPTTTQAVLDQARIANQAKQIDLLQSATRARDKLDDLAREGRGISKTCIWEMFATLPHSAATVQRRLIEHDPHLQIRIDFAVSLVTLDGDKFYNLVRKIHHHYHPSSLPGYSTVLTRDWFVCVCIPVGFPPGASAL
jgi:hypothetical protein